MAERQKVASIDVDGVLVPRIPVQLEVFSPWKWNKPLTIHHAFLTSEDRQIQDRQLSRSQQADLKKHSHRAIRPHIDTFLNSIDADIFVANTGRFTDKQWVDMNEKVFREGRIRDRFKEIISRPRGVGSDESKYHALLELANQGYDVTHYDDNASTVKRLATLLPQVKFVIIQDLSTSLLFSRKEMAKYQNVTRMAMRKDGTPKILPFNPVDKYHKINHALKQTA